jgi:hypothetical protein
MKKAILVLAVFSLLFVNNIYASNNPFVDLEKRNFFDVFETNPTQIAVWALGLSENDRDPRLQKDGWEKLVAKGSSADIIMVMEVAEMGIGIQPIDYGKYLNLRKSEEPNFCQLKLSEAMGIFLARNPSSDDLFTAVMRLKSCGPKVWHAFFASGPTEMQLAKVFERSPSPYREEAEKKLFWKKDQDEYSLVLMFYHSARSDEAAQRIIASTKVRPEVIAWVARDSKNKSTRKKAQREYEKRMGTGGMCFIGALSSL